MKHKKILSVLLALVMAFTTMTVFAVNSSAEGIESTAKTAENNKTYTTKIEMAHSWYNGTPVDYKITAASAGKLIVSLVSYADELKVSVLDKNGKTVDIERTKSTIGTVGEYCYWDKTMEKCSGKITYKIKKGTYYIRIYWPASSYGGNRSGKEKLQVKFTFPTGDDASSSDAKLTNFTMTMKVGDTIQLGADLSAKTDDNITWKSSKTSVAKVSAVGKVTAQAKGTAVITAALGSSSLTIKIIVS